MTKVDEREVDKASHHSLDSGKSDLYNIKGTIRQPRDPPVRLVKPSTLPIEHHETQ